MGDDMKKFFVILIWLAMITSNCFAMSFSQPVKIGEIGYRGGLDFTGATSIKDYSTVKRQGIYNKGIARFGNSLYFYFNTEYYDQNFKSAKTLDDHIKLRNKVSRFGGADVKNSVPIFVFAGGTEIYQIKNDGGIELYLTKSGTGAGDGFEVFGTTKEGKWVRYFDTGDARKNFGIPRDEWFSGFFTFGDAIIIQYRPQKSGNNSELRYKWDNNAQWFGIENKTNEDLRAYIKNSSSKFVGISTGSGIGFLIDKNAVITEKNNNGCIVSFRPISMNSNRGHESISYGGVVRYLYDLKSKKIYREKIEKNNFLGWDYVNPSVDHTILEIAEIAYYFAYNKHFFNKPISYRAKDLK